MTVRCEIPMFCIKIANIPIGIENRYPYVRHLCADYETDGEEPVFTVSVTEEEILKEQNGEKMFSKGYCEGLCIYRKICLALIKYDAFLMHSAAISMDDDAYAFTAQSGIGKTTHIRLWKEQFGDRVQIINGDKPIYRFIEGQLYVCGTPWCGKECLGSNIMRPVRSICFLKQGPENHIRSLNISEVSRRIFSQVLLPKDQENFDCFWMLLERMIMSEKFFELECNRQPEAAILAYQTMRRREIC